jgi:hypothetical protein
LRRTDFTSSTAGRIPSVGFGQSSTGSCQHRARRAGYRRSPPPLIRRVPVVPGAPPTLPFIVFDGGGNVAQVPFEFSGSEILIADSHQPLAALAFYCGLAREAIGD